MLILIGTHTCNLTNGIAMKTNHKLIFFNNHHKTSKKKMALESTAEPTYTLYSTQLNG